MSQFGSARISGSLGYLWVTALCQCVKLSATAVEDVGKARCGARVASLPTRKTALRSPVHLANICVMSRISTDSLFQGFSDALRAQESTAAEGVHR